MTQVYAAAAALEVDLDLLNLEARASAERRCGGSSAGGVGLAITEVVAVPGGDLIAGAAAEDSPNPRDDGPVVVSALARIRGDRVAEVVPLPRINDSVVKVEG